MRSLVSTRVLMVVVTLALLPAALLAQNPGNEWANDEPYNDLPSSGAVSTTVPARTTPWDATTSTYTGGQPGFSQTGSVPQANIPWSGVWWPRKACELSFLALSQGLSPFEKYDSIVFSNWGWIPGVAAWEADPYNQHNNGPTSGADWAGHCNGLAAAAILEPEPKQSVQVRLGSNARLLKLNIANAAAAKNYLFYDGNTDYNFYRSNGQTIELTVADQKGWLCELYMNVYTQQFENRDLLGHRYSSPDIDLRDSTYKDIYPHYFHYLLQTFIKNRQQAFVCEVDPGFPVNNHPLYRYESYSTYYPQQRKYAVTTTVYFTDYARAYNEVGTTTMKQTYTYDLLCDAEGRIQSGEWTNSSLYNHPDFVWIPTGLAPTGNGYSNSCLDSRYAKYIMGRNQ